MGPGMGDFFVFFACQVFGRFSRNATRFSSSNPAYSWSAKIGSPCVFFDIRKERDDDFFHRAPRALFGGKILVLKPVLWLFALKETKADRTTWALTTST
jgi:hypothetical protein